MYKCVFVFAENIFLNACIHNYFINNNMNVKHELDMFLSEIHLCFAFRICIYTKISVIGLPEIYLNSC